MINPIYKPKGRAGEYAEYAINIYNGCSHGCGYCYARKMAKRFNMPFETRLEKIRPKENIIENVESQLNKGKIKNETIMLCFTCDPYPQFDDTSATTEIIKLIKSSGNNVQILTKGGMKKAIQDLVYFDENDWFGVTLSGDVGGKNENFASSIVDRLLALKTAYDNYKCKTWVSCEPVINTEIIKHYITEIDFVDFWKIGKLNGVKNSTDWQKFGYEIEKLCQDLGRTYYIKHDLRNKM